jgi:membrane protein YdbS with pleckstrin-like domain
VTIDIPIRHHRVLLYYLTVALLLAFAILVLLSLPRFLNTGEFQLLQGPGPRVVLVISLVLLVLGFLFGMTRPTTHRVEGPYLIISNRFIFHSVRKIHFRDLSDYKSWSDPLMRLFGIGMVTIATAGGPHANRVYIIGVEDCENWRNRLCELDDQAAVGAAADQA